MFARTPRLTLRPGWPEDAPALAQAMGHRDVVGRLSRVPWPYTVDDAREWLARPRSVDNLYWLILLHEGAATRLIGGIGLHAEQPVHELGYWLTPDAWGQGYATEAGRAVLDIARHCLAVKRVRARHHADNPASARVLHKLGFRPTGRVAALPCLATGDERLSVEMEQDLSTGCNDDPDHSPLMAA